MPDLDTSNVGFLAYYNTIEQGGGITDLDPETALDYNRIDSYTLYDNGFEAKVLYGDLEMTVRLKTDGWCVAYQDYRTDTFTGVNNHTRYYNLAPSMFQFPSTDNSLDYNNDYHSASDRTLLETRGIYGTIKSLDSWDSIAWDRKDVGYYNYAFPNQTNFTILNTTNEDEATRTYTAVRGSDTEVPYAVAAVGSWNQNSQGYAEVDGTLISDFSSSAVVVDMIPQGLLPDQGNDVQYTLDGRGTLGSLFVWS